MNLLYIGNLHVNFIYLYKIFRKYYFNIQLIPTLKSVNDFIKCADALFRLLNYYMPNPRGFVLRQNSR